MLTQYCMVSSFRFLHEDAFTEPISIDQSLSSNHNGQQLQFVLEQDHLDKPPLCPPKPFISTPVLVSSYTERVSTYVYVHT